MKRTLLYLATFSLSLFLACSPFAVNSDYDREIDFSDYHAFKMLKQKGGMKSKGMIDNQLNRKRIRQTVGNQLIKKGFTEVKKGPADFLIAVHIGVQKKVDVDVYGYRGWRAPYPGSRVKTVRKYKEGTIVVDFIDAGQKQLVWRGWAESAIKSPQHAGEDINDAVAELMKQFPPKK